MSIDTYSFVNLLRSRLGNPRGEAAGLEGETSREIARRGGPPRSFGGDLVPLGPASRALDTATGSGAIAPTLAAPIDGPLRPTLVLARLGVTILPGLTGAVSIPVASGGARAYWVTEHNAPPESNPSVDSVALTPKTVAATVEFSRSMVMQGGPAVEAFVRRDLEEALAVAVDRAALAGSGIEGQPLGLLFNPDVPVLALGTNGGPLDWAALCQLEREIAEANADGVFTGLATTPAVRERLRQSERTAGSGPIWDGGRVLDGPAIVTTSLPSNMAKGTGTNLSAAIFGDFSRLVIGYWGAFELLMNPFTGQGVNIEATAFLTVGIAIRRPEAFRRIVDINTSA